MNNSDPLASLRDIHLPNPVSWWPLASGWYWLAALLLVMVIIASLGCYRLYRRYRERRNLQATLNDILTRYRTDPSACDLLAELSVYLKRLLITYFPSNKAALRGKDWLHFLDDLHGEPLYSQGTGRLLLTAPYQKTLPDDAQKLIPLIESTIQIVINRRHKRS